MRLSCFWHAQALGRKHAPYAPCTATLNALPHVEPTSNTCTLIDCPMCTDPRIGRHEVLPGVRRSARQKQEPLKWWLNEKLEFGRSHK